MTRQTIKNKINATLHETTKGLFSDENWVPVHAAFRKLEEMGWTPQLTGARYGHDANGNPDQKVWTFEIACGNKPIYGIITAHGAGTVTDPLCCYDVSAYVS